MKIVMIGAGYVGLTTGACFASLSHDVTCVDVDAGRVASLAAGKAPFYEPGLEALLLSGRQAGRLHFSTDMAGSVATADAVFVAVGTPSGPDGAIDLAYVEAAITGMARALRPGTLVVVKSTVVAGTARRLRHLLVAERGRDDVPVASNPEFLREGSAIADFFSPDRLVFGTDDAGAGQRLDTIYAELIERGVPVVRTSTASAELTKYAANAFLALKIGFINDVAELCAALGGDVEDVARGIGLDARIGSAFLAAGPGFGGSCFPKDTRAFAALGRRHGAPQPLVECLIAANGTRQRDLAQRVVAEAGGAGRTVALLGLAFKADTDDVRESPALAILADVLAAGCRVRVYDPMVGRLDGPQFAGATFCSSALEAASGADATVIATEWNEFRGLPLQALARLMRGRTLLDYRNLFASEAVTAAGLRHVSLGRPVREPLPAARGGVAPAGLLAASPM